MYPNESLNEFRVITLVSVYNALFRDKNVLFRDKNVSAY